MQPELQLHQGDQLDQMELVHQDQQLFFQIALRQPQALAYEFHLGKLHLLAHYEVRNHVPSFARRMQLLLWLRYSRCNLELDVGPIATRC
jgi:hypothetical protein